MKKIIFIMGSIFALLYTLANGYGQKPPVELNTSQNTPNVAAIITDPAYKLGTIRHIVLIRYKEGVTDAQKQVATERFMNLTNIARRNNEPYIVSIETGQQDSPEKLNLNLQQAFIVTFKSEGDRNYYVGKPYVTDPQYTDIAHEKFKSFIKPLIAKDGLLVFDYRVSDRFN